MTGSRGPGGGGRGGPRGVWERPEEGTAGKATVREGEGEGPCRGEGRGDRGGRGPSLEGLPGRRPGGAGGAAGRGGGAPGVGGGGYFCIMGK